MRTAPLCAALVACAGTPALSQALRDCNTFEANARNTYPPYEQTIRSYANGAIRVIALDTSEPACCSFHVMVTHPSADGLYADCTLISADGSLGFGTLFMDRIGASYESATGLTVTLPVGHWDEAAGRMREAPLVFTVNQATGTVTLAGAAPGPATK
ncbi:hypothetical protein DZD18_10730 [Rhodobacteraceae bacterium W635]|uniref:hypothetical protein n=1 Tax=Nioella halotolerans TaxID=2303578 RepID=UPI000E3BBE61|nr:hypothetical protein DZD18_10730 [Rhodobacteraceae bacterium W635]